MRGSVFAKILCIGVMLAIFKADERWSMVKGRLRCFLGNGELINTRHTRPSLTDQQNTPLPYGLVPLHHTCLHWMLWTKLLSFITFCHKSEEQRDSFISLQTGCGFHHLFHPSLSLLSPCRSHMFFPKPPCLWTTKIHSLLTSTLSSFSRFCGSSFPTLFFGGFFHTWSRRV